MYETARFGGAVVMDILRTHPTVLISGVVYDNPLFVPPDQFLNELRARRMRTRA
jgi:pimeloyl-ACP methyl ester carboxylesterase